MPNFYYKVANHTFRVRLNEEHGQASLLENYVPFAVSAPSAPPLFVLNEEAGLPESTEGFTEIGQFDCGGANHGVYRNGNHYRFYISDVQKQKTGLLECSRDFSQGRIRLFGETAQRRFALNNALMILFAFAAAPHSTLLIHAAVVCHQGRGYIFLGKSGTGKSTHARLWLRHIQPSELLNDDNPVLGFQNGRATVFGSPWSGKTPCYRNECAPVGAITRLEQFPQNVIVPEKKVTAFASLLSSCSTMIWDKETYSSICDSVSRFVSTVPMFHLKCRPDEEAAQVCHEATACHR